YVKDFATGQTTIASVDPAGHPLDAPSREINHLRYVMSGDGRRVLFTSDKQDLTPNDTNFTEDLYLRDLAAGTTTMVSAGPSGTSAAAPEFGAFFYGLSVTPDGRYACLSTELNLSGLPDLLDNSGEDPMADVYVKDLDSGATRVLSTDVAGGMEIGGSALAMSADARYVLYSADAVYTEPEDPDFFGTNLFLYDLSAGTRTLLNRHPDGKLFD